MIEPSTKQIRADVFISQPRLMASMHTRRYYASTCMLQQLCNILQLVFARVGPERRFHNAATD